MADITVNITQLVAEFAVINANYGTSQNGYTDGVFNLIDEAEAEAANYSSNYLASVSIQGDQADFENALKHSYVIGRFVQEGAPNLASFLGSYNEYAQGGIDSILSPDGDTNKDWWANREGEDSAARTASDPSPKDALAADLLSRMGDINNNGTIDRGELIADSDGIGASGTLYSVPTLNPAVEIVLPNGDAQLGQLAGILFDLGDEILDSFSGAPNWLAAAGANLTQGLNIASAAIPELLKAALAPIDAVAGLAPTLRLSTYSPLVLDVNGNGYIDLTSIEDSNAHFDLWGDGFSKKLGWITDGDGLLALDKNANGQIDSLNELFGSNYPLSYLSQLTEHSVFEDENGFAKLAAYDSNDDGLISSLDDVWSDLRVWLDANEDGITDTGELVTLDSLNIASIDVGNYELEDFNGFNSGGFTREIEGNVVTHTSTFTMTDSSIREIVDVWFEADLLQSVSNQEYSLDLRALYLPTLRGYGQLPGLHIAASADNGTNGLLEQLIDFQDGQDATTVFSEFGDVQADVEALLFSWAGIDAAEIQSNQDYSQAGLFGAMPEYFFIQKLLGQNTDYLGVWYDQSVYTPRVWAGVEAISDAWSNLVDYYSARLAFQVGASEIFEDVTYDVFADTFSGDFSLSQSAIGQLETEASSHADKEGFWNAVAKFIDNIQGIENLSAADITLLDTAISDSTSGAYDWDAIAATLDEQLLFADDGGDTVNGTRWDDYILGGDGNDTLIGGDGNDTLVGGDNASVGTDDVFDGGQGDDIYVDGRGDDTFIYEAGHDVIRQTGNGAFQDHDIIEFASGINVSDVSLHISQMTSWSFGAWHVAFEVEGKGSIAVMAHGYGSVDTELVDELHFVDSTVIDVPDMLTTYHGTTENDQINTANWATDGDIVVYGYGGDDHISVHSAGTQTAWVDGGSGDDYLQGSTGDDTLYLSAGDDQFSGAGGQNTILLPESYSLSDVSFYRYTDARIASNTANYKNDALIVVDGLGSVTIVDQFSSNNGGNGLVQTLKFHDGSTVDLTTQDYITIGTSGDDVFTETGNWFDDDNIYQFDEGNDVIQELAGTDTILFGEGIGFGDLTIYREDLYSSFQSSDHLIIEDGSGNSMKVHLQFYNSSYAVEKLEFADSSVVNIADLEIETRGDDTDNQIAGFDTGDASSDDTIYAYDGNDDVYAYAGDDLVYGGDGNDNIFGGIGADTLYGDGGNDDIDGEAGDDVIDGGDGSDVIDGGADDDTIIFTVADNVGAADTINGGTGEDTLRINISSSDYSVPLYNDIQAFRTFVTNNYDTGTSSGAAYNFEYIGLTASNIENVDVYVDGVLSTAAPTPAATAPVAYDDEFYGQSDQNLNGHVLDGSGGGKDFDFNGDTLSVTSETKSTAQGGSVTINSDGSFTYTPATSFAGVDSFDYTVTDGSANDTGSVTLNISNDPPPNLVTGTASSEALYGTSGVDLIEGKAGDDTLYGDQGSDIYLYNSGDGNDTIVDYGGSADVLEFGAGITQDDLRFMTNGNDLEIYHGSSKIILDYQFHGSYGYEIETAEFADGSTLDLLGNLTFKGTSAAETIYGKPTGDDTLQGAGGNDSLYGGDGNDTYIYESGDGSDLIVDYGGSADKLVFGGGITEGDLRFTKNGQDLEIHIGADTITLDYQFNTSYGYEIETAELADGTIIDLLNNLTFEGTSGVDSLQGSGNADVLNALEGNDSISAGDGDDTLNGGTGNDTLYGEQGNDTYFYNLGDGNDIIVDYGGSADVLEFGSGITQDDVRLSRVGQDLIVNIGSNTITLDYQFNSSYGYEIETARFADGSTMSLLDNVAFEGTPSADTVYGFTGNDFLYGYAGNDTLDSDAGNDTLVGGQGNDSLHGGQGDDTYMYNPGDGTDLIVDNGGANDKLVFGLGILKSDIRLLTNGSDLEVYYGVDKITLDYQLHPSYGYEIETAVFADGSTLDLLNDLTFTGDEGNNTISGLASEDDTLVGGAGNDSLYGSSGDDTYLYNLGDGTDFIQDTGGSADKLLFGPGIDADDLRFFKNGQDLEIYIGNDKITLDYQFRAAWDYEIEMAEFHDGSTMDLLYNLTFTGTSAGEYVYGQVDLDDVIVGAGGNDTLYGESGNDTYVYNIGDGSDDIIDTGGSADVLAFGSGITINDLHFATSGNDLIITIGSDTITIDNQFHPSYGYEIETASFADSSTMDLLDGLTFAGTDSAEYLYGSNRDDIIYGDEGADNLYGYYGADTFLYLAADLDGSKDTIHDFSTGDGDALDIASLIEGYDPLNDAITDFVWLTNAGSNTDVYIDQDGAGTAEVWTQIATLNNVTGLTDEAALEANGTLITV